MKEENMAHVKTQKQLIFDSIFTEDIKKICVNNPPEGLTPEDFNVVEELAYGVLMYSSDKEAQALEVLFTATGRAWYEAKKCKEKRSSDQYLTL